MNRIAASATMGAFAGSLLAGGYLGAPFLGLHLSPSLILVLAASVVFGASVTVISLNLLAQKAEKPTGGKLLGLQLKQADNLIHKFPGRAGALDLSIRADQKIDQLEIFKNPDGYKDKDITVRLRGSSTKFNPIDLKQLFVALNQQPGFLHLILLDKNDEFIGYLPGFAAKREFTRDNAESMIAKFLVQVFDDDANSANLTLIDGAGKTDIVSDETKVGQLIDKMAGGFKRLIVLKNGYHRRPVGLVNFNDLLVGTMRSAVSTNAEPAGVSLLGSLH